MLKASTDLFSMRATEVPPADVSMARITRRAHDGVNGRDQLQTSAKTAVPNGNEHKTSPGPDSNQPSRSGTGLDWAWTVVTRRQRARPPSSSSSSSSSSPQPRRKGSWHPPQLLTWDQVPSWYAQTDRIRTGFRPVTNSTAQCAASLAYLHNESVNIYSHLVPGAVFLAGAAALLLLLSSPLSSEIPLYQLLRASLRNQDASGPPPAIPAAAPPPTTNGTPPLTSRPEPSSSPSSPRTDMLMITLFLATSAACFGTSAAYHALVCHSRAVAERWVRLDYAAIVLQIWGSFISGLYMCFYCERGLRNGYWAMITTLSVMTALVVLDARLQSLQWRMLRLGAFVATGLSALAPIAHAVAIFPYGQLDRQSGLRWYYLEGLFILAGAMVYATHFPESSRPVRYDIWGASHQLFHVLVVMGALAHLYGIVSAAEWNHRHPRCPAVYA